MQTRLLLPLATTLAGFALGWALKPAPSPEAAATEAGAENPRTSGRSTSGDVSSATKAREAGPVIPGAHLPPDEPRQEELEHAARMQRAFKDAVLQRDRGKLIRLVEALNLTEEQIAQMETLLAEQRQAQAPLNAQDAQTQDSKTSLETLIQAAKENDAKFRALLTPEQDAALDALRARQNENQVETRAQRDLAEVTERLDLTAQQREAALAALRSRAAKVQASFPDGSQLVSESSLLPLVPAGQYSRGSIEAMTLLANDPPESNDALARHRKMEEIQQRQVAERTEALAGILTPAQLDQLRAAMDAKTISQSPRRIAK